MVDFSETIAASDLKVSRSRHLIEYILKHFRNAPLTKMTVSSLIVIIFTWQ